MRMYANFIFFKSAINDAQVALNLINAPVVHKIESLP